MSTKEETVTLAAVLENLEDRAFMQSWLIKQYNSPLISFTVNMPGPIKLNHLSRKIYNEGILRLEQILSIEKISINTAIKLEKITGLEAFYSLSTEAILLKKLTCKLEDSDQIGRLFDLDVIGVDGVPLSRRKLSLPMRRCLICDQPAAYCARSRFHSVQELQLKITDIVEALL